MSSVDRRVSVRHSEVVVVESEDRCREDKSPNRNNLKLRSQSGTTLGHLRVSQGTEDSGGTHLCDGKEERTSSTTICSLSPFLSLSLPFTPPANISRREV